MFDSRIGLLKKGNAALNVQLRGLDTMLVSSNVSAWEAGTGLLIFPGQVGLQSETAS